MNTIQIGNRTIARGERTLVIAEIGVNHDGSLQRALDLVQIAADGGADAIKLQIFRADQLMHGSAGFAEYQRDRVADNSPIEMLRRYELNEAALGKVVEKANSLGLISIATPFSLSDVELIERLDLPAIKIASPDIVNRPLLHRAMRAQRPLLISTGASTIDEVSRCVHWCDENPFALLHCVSSYPVDATNAHLAWIGELLSRFNVPIGYSDHAVDERCGMLAVAAGACVIEKHLTYDCAAEGPDHSASADPRAFARYVAAIRDAERLMGSGGKRVLPIEADVRSVSRQSLVLSRALRAGETVTSEAIMTQRPGMGISAAEVNRVVGRRVMRDLQAGTMLQWEMISSGTDAHAA